MRASSLGVNWRELRELRASARHRGRKIYGGGGRRGGLLLLLLLLLLPHEEECGLDFFLEGCETRDDLPGEWELGLGVGVGFDGRGSGSWV